MTDEELIARLRVVCTCNIDSTPCMAEDDCRDAIAAADRIEALVKRLDAVKDKAEAHIIDLMAERDRVEARAERLEAALREIIDEDQHQSEWRYWEKEDGHWARKARAALEPVAALSRCPYGASGDDCCGGYCSINDDKKGGDAYAVFDPRHAPHEASPGVTAGAIPKGAAK